MQNSQMAAAFVLPPAAIGVNNGFMYADHVFMSTKNHRSKPLYNFSSTTEEFCV